MNIHENAGEFFEILLRRVMPHQQLHVTAVLDFIVYHYDFRAQCFLLCAVYQAFRIINVKIFSLLLFSAKIRRHRCALTSGDVT